MHTSVLLKECMDGLDIRDGDTYVDGTLGSAGHAEAVANSGKKVLIVGIDRDQDALNRSEAKLKAANADFKLVLGSYRDIDTALAGLGLTGADKILLDLGLSSNQFEESGRGFTFKKDEPLLMSFKKEPGEGDLTAREIVNEWDEENIAAIIEGYGEEKFAGRIARGIVKARKEKPINTTFELVEVVKRNTPFWYHYRKIHPATKTFQALRITVNDEIETLKDGLKKGFDLLKPEGRMAIISFHSLEDRVVKKQFREWADQGKAEVLTKRPIEAGEEELAKNPRARSAKLRILIKKA